MTAEPSALLATPLSPVFVLLFGGLFLLAARRRLPRIVVLILSLTAVLGAALLFVWSASSNGVGALTLSWDPIGLQGGTWTWQLDAWGGLACGLVLLLGLVALLLAWEQPEARWRLHLPGGLILLAMALLVVLSGNLLTLAGSWVALDVAVGLWSIAGARGVDGRLWAVNSLGAFLLVVGLMFAGPEGVHQPLSQGLEPLAVLAFLLAAMVRCAAYPVHFGLVQPPSPPGGLALWRLIPALTGVWMLGHAQVMLEPYWGSQVAWASVGAVGMLAGAASAWLADDGSERVAWASVSYVGLAVMVAALRVEPDPSALVWVLLALGLGIGCLVVGQAVNHRWGWRYPLALGAATMIGLPGTPGFVAWMALATAQPLKYLTLWAIFVLGETLLVAALLLELRGDERAPLGQAVPVGSAIRLLSAVVLLSAPLVISGVLPPLTARALGLPPGHSLFRGLVAQVEEISPLAWVSLLLPWGVGAVLAWKRSTLLAGRRGWWEAAAHVASAEWGYRALDWSAQRMASFLRGFGAVLEGEGYLGWLAVAVLLGWLLLNV